MLSIDIGVITAFGGAVGNIPPGWFLCDGTNGTPDLRNKFIVATGPLFSVGDEAGAIQHEHTFTGDGHTHAVPPGFLLKAGTDLSGTTDTRETTGTTDPKILRPPYWALAYIQYRGP